MPVKLILKTNTYRRTHTQYFGFVRMLSGKLFALQAGIQVSHPQWRRQATGNRAKFLLWSSSDGRWQTAKTVMKKIKQRNAPQATNRLLWFGWPEKNGCPVSWMDGSLKLWSVPDKNNKQMFWDGRGLHLLRTKKKSGGPGAETTLVRKTVDTRL